MKGKSQVVGRCYFPRNKGELIKQMKLWWPDEPVSKWKKMKKAQLWAIWRKKKGMSGTYFVL